MNRLRDEIAIVTGAALGTGPTRFRSQTDQRLPHDCLWRMVWKNSPTGSARGPGRSCCWF